MDKDKKDPLVSQEDLFLASKERGIFLGEPDKIDELHKKRTMMSEEELKEFLERLAKLKESLEDVISECDKEIKVLNRELFWLRIGLVILLIYFIGRYGIVEGIAIFSTLGFLSYLMEKMRNQKKY